MNRWKRFTNFFVFAKILAKTRVRVVNYYAYTGVSVVNVYADIRGHWASEVNDYVHCVSEVNEYAYTVPA